MDKKNIWFITAKTNLHVGNGNTSSYGLIDNAVQRDALTGLPCINDSSLKGALNEYCSNGKNGKEFLCSNTRTEIFGCDKNNKGVETKEGKYVFFDAHILFLPIQDDVTLFHWVTSAGVLDRFKADMLNLASISLQTENGELVEQLKSHLKMNDEKNIDILSDKDFKALCSDENLPIIARNCLDNGESINLWYEQIIPAETVFYTLINNKEDNQLFPVLNEQIIQIGAGATIGRGYCKLLPFEFQNS